MPGPISHLIAQQRLVPYLRRLREEGQPYAELLAKDPCSPYAAFGSIGPDFLFFSLKEYGTPLDELANFIFKIYDAFEPFIDFYEKNIEPVTAQLEAAISAVDQTLFQGLFGQIKDTADLASSTLLTLVGDFVTRNVDLFYPFYPNVQKGVPDDNWYWFDFLHDRRSGRFGSALWKLSEGDDDLKRYCLGYVSHIGMDVVGHPFVNAVVGGPYRTHWHRHKLVENWIDSYARLKYADGGQTINCLRLGEEDEYLPAEIAGSYYYRLCEFKDGRLPDKLAKVFAEGLRRTYTGIPSPPLLGTADLDSTYRMWLMWFKRSTSIGSARKPTPVPPPGGGVIALINDYVSGYPSFPGNPSPGGGFSIWGIFKAIAAFLVWLAEGLVYTFTWIITHSWDIITLPYTEAIALLKWLLYQIQKGLYEIYDNARFSLVLGGYLFPEAKDLQVIPWGKAFVNTQYVHMTGGPAASFSLYPRRQETHSLFGPMEHHLIYPGTLVEMPYAEPAPKPFHGANPDVFISAGVPGDPATGKLYNCIGPYGATDRYTHYVDQQTWGSAQFGSSLHFTARLIVERMADLPNFNLDGDRGYGWKTWHAKEREIETTTQAGRPTDVNYVDP